MEYLEFLVPGVGFSCTILLVILAVSQFYIFKKTNYKRALNIFLFCLLASVFSFEQFVVQSRLFSQELSSLFVSFAKVCLFFSMFFYIKAINFFIAIKDKYYKAYLIIIFVLASYWIISLPLELFTDIELTFISDQLKEHPSYFVHSYTGILGEPHFLSIIFIAVFASVNLLMSSYLLKKVLSTTRDMFFAFGLILTIGTTVSEYLFLPLTYDYYVPLLFLGNIFEASRMSFLSTKEYIVETNNSVQKEEVKQEEPHKKYQNSNLSEERITELAEKLTSVLQEAQLYKDPNLNLEKLAKAVGVPSYQLSQVINVGLNQTFNDLMNTCRINYAKQLLHDSDYDNKTIITVALTSGYNSKSTFNLAFKKLTGVTPTEYRRTRKDL